MTQDALIEQAAARLRAGGVVAFPTETVYGLGADASNPDAVRRVFTLKGRPADHPLIVHIGAPPLLERWARDIPPVAWRLAKAFWPGPLTLILRRGQAPLAVTGGQDSVGLRMPHHPVALALLDAFGGGIAAPSANRFGRVSPTQAGHVGDEFGDAVDLVLDGGACRVGLESTILSLVSGQPVLLRPGAITPAALEAVIGAPLADRPPDSGLRAPGTLEAHYAPATRLLLCPGATVEARLREWLGRDARVALLHYTPALEKLEQNPLAQAHPMPARAGDYGRALYAALRRLDAQGFDVILVELPPPDDAWRAVSDRLGRASHGSAC